MQREGTGCDEEGRTPRQRLIFFGIAIFVAMSPIVFYLGSNLIKFGKFTRLSPADFVSTVQRDCLPTVNAIKQYQRDTGHLPDSIHDLQPKYLKIIPASGQDIEAGQFCQWTKFHHLITYSFTPNAEDWRVTGPYVNGPIVLPPGK